MLGIPGEFAARFIRFLFARGASSMSFQMLAVAVGWHIYRLTGSAFDLGLIGLAQFLPMVCLTLVVGHIADRYDRRKIVALCMAIESLAALVLAFGVFGGWITREVMYVLVVIGAAARAFESPTSATLLPALVSREHLQRATALSTSTNQTAQIVGPALGGVLYALNPTLPFLVIGLAFLTGACLVSGLKLVARPASRAPVTLKSVFSGIHFIRSQPVMLGTISLDLFAVLLGGATALLPIFAKDILHTGSWGLGVLRSAPAIGAVSMSLLLAHRPLSGPIGRILFGALLVFGGATVVFAVSSWLPLSLLALFVLGAADSISMVVRSTLVQLMTPDEMLGRVSAVNMLFIGTSNQLGEFESGTTAAWFGTVPAAVIGGVGTVIVTLLWMRLFPELREIRSLDGSRTGAGSAAEADPDGGAQGAA
ncbi:MAG TPA: MFS transporter [Pararobbsia sp.]|nr:MFS transporter [Pararobbsia sp.]